MVTKGTGAAHARASSALAAVLRQGVQYAISVVFARLLWPAGKVVTQSIMTGLIVAAEVIILILFGPRWLAAAPILSVPALAGIFWPMLKTCRTAR